ncbi:GDSL-type esterase/lipase family protein [Rhodococcus opacus]|nr:GDSL-type esterase/lipase family protein [Rhodococcus opacus]
MPTKDERQGALVAVGDSIINGFNRPIAQVPALGFGQLLAQAMDLSYTRYAKGGSTSRDIVEQFIPRVRGRYDVGVLSCGTNDAYQRMSMADLEANLTKAVGHLSGHCDRVVVLTIPISVEATDVVRRVAATVPNVHVVDAHVRGVRLLRADLIHPTSVGQMELADRAARALCAPLPSKVAGFPIGERIEAGYLLAHWIRLPVTHLRRIAKRLLGR